MQMNDFKMFHHFYFQTLQLTQLFLVLEVFLYQSIALWAIYISSFEIKLMRSVVWTQIHEHCLRSAISRKNFDVWSELVTQHLTRSVHTQKTNDEASKELPIDINTNKIQWKTTELS